MCRYNRVFRPFKKFYDLLNGSTYGISFSKNSKMEHLKAPEIQAILIIFILPIDFGPLNLPIETQ